MTPACTERGEESYFTLAEGEKERETRQERKAIVAGSL